MSDPAQVFVSYNRADRAWAEWIAWTLEEAGFSAVIQAWDIRPGQNFVLAMQEAAAQSRYTVIVLSPDYLAAEYTQPEWAAAFAQDPRGEKRMLIPVRVRECKPNGLLSQIVYVDLVGLGDDEAVAALRGAFAERAKPDERPSFPGSATSGPPAAQAAERPAFPGTHVSTAKLPVTGEHFVGRADELGRLDAAWDDPAANVVSFVAFGGVGKSALVNRWLDRLAADGWRGAERVLGWSFYSQGTDAAGASSEAFTEFALDWLGYDGEPILSPWRKGEELARRVRSARTLLVLDGLEPLQHPPGAQTGRIKDPAVQALVRELAVKNPGLCVITTRLAVADIAGRAGADSVDLEQLPPAAGAKLLCRLGVQGSDAELEAASEEFGGHGLALSLLSTYLRDVCDGDVRRRGEVPLLDEEIEQGGHARRVMQSYERWLEKGPERQVLSLVGLFDRPAEAEALAALRVSPAIPGLTEGIGAGEETRWRQALARLRKAQLVAGEDAAGGVDAHPLVREYFGERLRAERPEAWRAGHERLYEHYKQAAPELPKALEAMLPLYAAVVHGCQAGRVQEAMDEVYLRRILRGAKHFSWKTLGAFGAELTALAGFFSCPWTQPDSRLSAADQAWILNEAGYVLGALGRLREAVQPMRSTLNVNLAESQWSNAAVCAINLSELNLTLGEVAKAVEVGEKSVQAADRVGEPDRRMTSRATLADALHQAGQLEESLSAFQQAEAIQAQWQPGHPRLYSVSGFRYCDLLLGTVRLELGGRLDRNAAHVCQVVRDRVRQTLEWGVEGGYSLLSLALDRLNLGRTLLGLALTSKAAPDFTAAAEHLDRAVDGLRQAGEEVFVARGLLARAGLRRIRGDTDAAASDLQEAKEIADRGHMLLHLADAHLEWTRLHLQAGDRDAARRHFEKARELVKSTGYGRRDREVAYLERRLAE